MGTPRTASGRGALGDKPAGLQNRAARGHAGGGAGSSSRPRSLSSGDHLLRVALAGGGDAEPRTDTRLHLVTVAPTPGVVLLAAPADWDSRFLYRTLREVGQLPIRGYVRLDGDRWRSMASLRAGSAETWCGERRAGPIC